jgi:hypothetical protein
MRKSRLWVGLLVFASACASSGASETFEAPAAMGVGRQPRQYTAIATAVPVGPDSAYQLLLRAYAMLEIPMKPSDEKRTVSNDDLKARRHLAGIPMQNVVDCGEKLGLENAETWQIDINLVSYVEADPKGGSQVLTKIQAMGNRPEGSNLRQTACATTGEFEKKIGEMVNQLVVSK